MQFGWNDVGWHRSVGAGWVAPFGRTARSDFGGWHLMQADWSDVGGTVRREMGGWHRLLALLGQVLLGGTQCSLTGTTWVAPFGGN